MLYSGSLLKMNTQLESTVEYEVPIGNQLVELNQFLGKYVKFKWNNNIYCIIFRFKYVSPFLSKQSNKTEMVNG